MSKRLLHELGHSLSFGRLSLKAKVLWPMLLASSDDQGRGLAESDAIKWYVCPNVPEITPDDVPDLLGEMVDQGMILVYECERGSTYQAVRWWEYQQLQWARPSKYTPPEGWTDRIRYSDRGDYHQIGWDTTGGLSAEDRPKPARKPARKQPPPKVDAQPNPTQLNPIEPNPIEDQESAAAPSAIADTLPSTFQGWHLYIKEAENRSQTIHRLHQMCKALYPGLDPPDHGYIGRVAKRLHAGRLADLLWQTAPHPPTGDLLAYIQGVAKRGNGKAGENSSDITLDVIRKLEEEERANNTSATQ